MPDITSPDILIYKLCSLLSVNKSKEAISKYTQYALRMLSASTSDSIPNIDETGLIEKIKLQFSKTNRMDDAIKISVLHRRLKQFGCLENRWSILYLLYSLSSCKDSKVFGNTLLFRQGLASTSTPVNGTSVPNEMIGDSITSSSGFGTAVPASSRTTLSLETPSQFPSNISLSDQTHGRSTALSSRLGWTLTPSSYSSGNVNGQVQQRASTSLGTGKQQTPSSNFTSSNYSKSTGSEKMISQADLIRQLLYVFQGIPSENIKFREKENAFCIDSNLAVDKRDRQAVHRLCELGWLHNHIKKYVTSHNKDKAFGLVGQAFCAALQFELTEYYRSLSVLQSQLQQTDSSDNSVLTLAKLNVWTSEPMQRLKWLAVLVDNCKGKKGGALASVVHSFLQTGDNSARCLTRRLLHVVSQPLFYIISRWIYDGELHDPFQEFFVAADLGVGNDRLWFDKYRMRSAMIPSFIKAEQAHKILLVGKSINFLRLVCRDGTAIPVKDRSKDFSRENSDNAAFSLEFATELKTYVDHAYEVTSSHLLQVLNDRYKMLTHLHALRKFLLLGQGDFIRHLLDLLQDELSKPANLLYRHNLNGPVEAAVRASNAQFEDSDVLARLDFRLLEINPGDCGWDVFSLDYHVDPPLNTLITPDVMLVYLRIFIFLWRAKRMEYNLASIWTGMMEQSRKLSPTLPHLQGVLHKGHALAAEMVHFVHQMQYYIAFEVLECSWADLQCKLEEAKDFDKIISAHHSFLQSLMKRCLLDQSSSNLLMQLRTIFDQIVKFEHLQRGIYEQATFEMECRLRYESSLAEAEKKGVWGTDVEKEGEEMARQKKFRKVTIPEMRARLKVCACAYQDMVVMFLQQLGKESDANLRNLRWRLDFNDIYRLKESSLVITKRPKQNKHAAESRK